MENQRNNKFIIGLGLVTIGFALFYFKDKKVKKIVPKVIETKNDEVEEELEEEGLPQQFIDDVKKMSDDELDKTIKGNKQILADTQVNEDEREAVEFMLEFCKREIRKRKS
jgi:hypothetical protein